MQLLKDQNLSGQIVLVRADLDIPRYPNCVLEHNDHRLRALIPTLNFLRNQGARIALCGHLSRPYGRVIPELSLRPIAKHLAELAEMPINFSIDCIGRPAEAAMHQLKLGEVVMLENLRYHLGETKNDPEFARELIAPADTYVLDAFATCHRNHASIASAPRYAKHCLAGLSLAHELHMLRKVTTNPDRPLAVMLGGIKVGTLLPIIQDLLPQTDTILLGGALANTFLAAQGHNVGASVFEADQLDAARNLIVEAGVVGCRLVLPQDVVVQNEKEREAKPTIKAVTEVGVDEGIVDLGPQTLDNFQKALAEAKTLVWSGPLGHTEDKRYTNGTNTMAQFVAQKQAYKIAGGGETVELIHQLHLQDHFDAISTGGNALLSFLEGRAMPGIMALQQAAFPAPAADINAA